MRNQKKYSFHPRWKMTLKLRTTSPLHVGNGEETHRDELTVKDEEKEQQDRPESVEPRKADITACIKDGKGKPFIPGSTFKGVLRQWLEQHLIRDAAAFALCQKMLGHGRGNGADSTETEQGGTAEFLAGILTAPITFSDQEIAPSYWDPETQTSVETAIAVDRVTRTAADKKLFYREVVPAGAGFTLTVAGTMPREQAALLAAALQAGFTAAQPISFGGDTANGGGRMQFEDLQVSCLDREEIAQWLTRQDGIMAEEAMRPFSREERAALCAEGDKWLRPGGRAASRVTINLRFAGPFLVNDPSRCQGKTSGGVKRPDHFPLQDRDGNPILPAKSVRGALRSQAEKIIRSLGGSCCDPARPCSPVYSKTDVQRLCSACRLFGNTGWQSRVKISEIVFQDSQLSPEGNLLHKQDFVAIDRFHGGSRDTAKFDATSFQQPAFTVILELDPDLDEAAKGLLALTLRDFEEGDISLGLGRSKGYGRILAEETTITGGEILAAEENLAAFRAQITTGNEESQPESCLSRNEPETASAVVLSAEKPGKQGAARGQAQSDGPVFHNPYHFIPVTPPKTATWLAKENFGSAMHDSHAVYRAEDAAEKKILHGRVRCTLTSTTPLFIGGKRDENAGNPKPIAHFQIDGDPAIPATSLRGMLSSLVEAASNSSLRVLDDAMMSCRHKIGEDSLSAIGMIVIHEGQHFLYPFALPIFDQRDKTSLSTYKAMFPAGDKGPLKVYLENAHRHGAMGGFIAGAQSWNLRHPQIYYLPESSKGELKTAGSRVLGRRYAGLVPTTTRTAATDQPGILRILGTQGRADIPATKKHELFLPVPDAFAADPRAFISDLKRAKDELFAIPPEVVATFEELADQRTRPQIKHPAGITPTQWLPYHLQGCSRNDGRSAQIEPEQLRLQEGDLVYFRPFPNSARQVAEISFSSIWRSRVQKKVHKFFHEELLPFNKDRKHISPAELLFGFVQQEKGGDQLAFAGKTVCSSARLQVGQSDPFTEKEVTLKILSSPKLPSPALYFDGPGYVAKHAMQNSSIRPQGRKQYLHALPNAADPQGVKKISLTGTPTKDGPYPWESRHEKEFENQKVRIRPLRKGVQFGFTVDFENCTEWELGLLLYALRPTEAYQHKIGMGKPLGLGSVQIDIEGVDLIDRKKRYAEDSLDAARYTEVSDQEALSAWRTRFADSMDPEIRHALELLGDPAKVLAPVHYPQVQGADIEKETFKWFVANDRKGTQGAEHLVPLSRSGDSLPTLHRQRE
ncbi:MAG: TIGR03986 family CRISPR-associated RAMP protein [Candidatus Electrothrix aestuarii]|uniref:TIGR03986 family CRISPR-associated RAMP protein n=1 Tax=Candidatus Electrothrix aestuarii TaxID=3062594 RepID=A0AAU8LR29_9BACT|nr:TIGR03986 family CRISPR-associated RAMP protein [Candidatus Electrothrix aestuarii]